MWALRGRALVLGPKEVGSRKMGLRGASRGGGQIKVGSKWWATPNGRGQGVGPRLVDPSLLVGPRGQPQGVGAQVGWPQLGGAGSQCGGPLGMGTRGRVLRRWAPRGLAPEVGLWGGWSQREGQGL